MFAGQAIAVERRQCWRDLGVILKVVRQEHKKALQEVFYNRIGINKGTDTYAIRCKAVADGLGWATAQALRQIEWVGGRMPWSSRALNRS